jgi:hypothetical protein
MFADIFYETSPKTILCEEIYETTAHQGPLPTKISMWSYMVLMPSTQQSFWYILLYVTICFDSL